MTNSQPAVKHPLKRGHEGHVFVCPVKEYRIGLKISKLDNQFEDTFDFCLGVLFPGLCGLQGLARHVEKSFFDFENL